MKMTSWDPTIQEILDLKRNNMLAVNAEYQRGSVWSPAQRKRLVDSVFRGYPIPLIYLRHIRKEVAGMQREDLEIIDGQQRITALYEFAERAFRLFHPIKDANEARFPNYLKSEPCPWGGLDFHSLTPELQEQFLSTPLSVVRIETDNENEIRDLFIRLQSGVPLNAQETRDAWPGDFTEYILQVGGKPQIPRYPGHDFFRRVLGMKPAQDRGRTRQLAAQIAMLFLSRRKGGPDSFTDINAGSIDDFYYANIDFNTESSEAVRLIQILDKLTRLLGDGKRPRPRAHDAIHLVLLTDQLWDDYTRNWEDRLPAAFEEFSAALVAANQTKDTAHPGEYWTRYGQWTRVSADRADRIRLRHEFYLEKMIGFLSPLQPKDPKRAFGAVEREFIYYRDKKCAVCRGTVFWSDAEIHHTAEHAKGGQTVLANGVLVHRTCHPKGSQADAFGRQRATSNDNS